MTNKTKHRAAIYARISEDRAGEAAGVDRQLAACRAEIEARGWTAAGEYVDNDVSAYSGKRRPAYERLLADAAAGNFDTVVVWAADRLYRRIADLERLVDALAGIDIDALHSGDVDLSTADGRMVARVLGSVGQHESEKKGERVAAAYQDRISRGDFGGGVRRLGYLRGMRQLHPKESAYLRDAYHGIAAGESLYKWVKEAEHRGIVGSAKGRPITSQVLKDALLRPANAGLVAYKGELLDAKSKAPTIVDEQLWRQVRAILTDPGRRTSPGPKPTTLLSGIARCGVCGEPVRGSQRSHGVLTYRCVRACVSRRRRRLDPVVTDAVLDYLEANADALRAEAAAATAVDLGPERAEAGRIRSQLEALSDLLAAGELELADYTTSTRKLRDRLAAIEADLASSSPRPVTAGALDDIRARWDELSLSDQRAIVSECVESVVVTPVPAGSRTWGLGVEILWKE